MLVKKTGWECSISIYVVIVQVVGAGTEVEPGKMLIEIVAVGSIANAHCEVVADAMVEYMVASHCPQLQYVAGLAMGVPPNSRHIGPSKLPKALGQVLL